MPDFHLPRRVAAAWEVFADFINVPIWQDVRRIDVLLLVLGIVCTLYYWFTDGWRGALLGAGLYLLILMTSLWFNPSGADDS